MDKCLKCGDPITGQEYYGSLCHKCNLKYFAFEGETMKTFYEKHTEKMIDCEEGLAFPKEFYDGVWKRFLRPIFVFR